MKLIELVNAQQCGTFVTSKNTSDKNVVVGGTTISEEQCEQLAKALGWLDYSKKSWEVIDKTGKFINGIKKYVTNDNILSQTDVTFQNKRKQDTESYLDRIKLIHPKFDITILYGAHGAGGTYNENGKYVSGGAYAVFSKSNNFGKPVFNCRTAKQLGEYINQLI